MRELREPLLARGGFGDSRDMDRALGELNEISRMRSSAHEAANLFRDFHIEVGGLTERSLRHELSRAEGVLARWAVMAAHEEFRTVDLARVENNGDWEATTEAEKGIGDLAIGLFMGGQIPDIIERDTPEAKLRIMVDPGLLSGDGLIAVRRKRLMLATTPVAHDFSDMRPAGHDYKPPFFPRGSRMGADVSLEIDKVSEFVLDLRRLQTVNPKAHEEIFAVTSEGTVAGEITGDKGAISPAVIEAAIMDRDPTLTPAITTYYADRKYKNIRRLDQDESAAELVT